jgi:hypothetical protein
LVPGVGGQAAGAGDVAEGAEVAGGLGGQDRGRGEAVGDGGVAEGEVDDLGDVGGDGPQPGRVRHGGEGGAAEVDAAAEQAVSGGLGVEPEQLLADALGVGVQDAVADVVAQRADVGDVVVEPLQFEQDRALAGGLGGYRPPGGVLDGEAVGEGVPDGGVAADALGQWQAGGGGTAFEEFLNAFVDEPQAGLEFEDGLADDGEAEVAGFDKAGVHRADRDLVDAGSFHGQEREGALGVAEARWWAGVGAHRVPAAGPVVVADQPARLRVADGDDAVQVVHLPFEPAGGEGQPGQAGELGPVAGQPGVHLDAGVGGPGGEQVDHPQGRSAGRAGVVVVGGGQGQPVPVGEQLAGPGVERAGVRLDDGPVRAGRRRRRAVHAPWSGHLSSLRPPARRRAAAGAAARR